MKKILYSAIVSLLIFSHPVYSENLTPINEQTPKATEKASVLFFKSSFPISGLNPNAESNQRGAYYPGFRGSNQLLIYTRSYGERTGTNEYGLEAIIQNNRVVKTSGADSTIPKDGYVISGNGKAKQWILKNLIEGAKVTINFDKNEVESDITPESYIYKAQTKYNDAKKEVYSLFKSNEKHTPNYIMSMNYLKTAKTDISKAKKQFNQQNYDNVYKLSKMSIEASNKSFYGAVPYIADEFNGIWVRPTEKTPESITNTLERIKNSGIKNVFLETYYHGYTIFPSKTMDKYSVTNQMQAFKGFDPLAVWVEEAHKRGLKVHVWFETFNVGSEPKTEKYKNIISVHPDWANIQRRAYLDNSPSKSELENSSYFLDPANPCVQKFLLELIDEISTNYKVDGINLDYIRYPASLADTFPNYLGSTWGYSQYARREFKKMYGVDPALLSRTEKCWEKWVNYRQNKVTEFVTKASAVIKQHNVMVTAVVFPNAYEANIKKLQNWDVWAANGLVDAFTPLVLGGDTDLIRNYMSEMKQKVPANVKIYPGLFQPFNAETPADLLKQFVTARSNGANGIMIFDYAHFTDEYKNALTTRAFSPIKIQETK
ncbi:MAG: family 10 glycosylhydrolase [bacterium]